MKAPDYFWNRWHPVAILLSPLSLLSRLVVFFRRILYRLRILPVYKAPVPVIVVGNLTVGGNGKTPLVIWLVRYLIRLGYRPGVVLRGYKGNTRSFAQDVKSDSDPRIVGDEAPLIAAETGVPVCVAPKRAEAIKALLKMHDVDIVVSDDGLQHYAMGRDLEIVVLNRQRGFGNGLLMPAGPLREGISRINSVDLVIVNGDCKTPEYCIRYHADTIRNLVTGEIKRLEEFFDTPVHVICGIGYPKSFLDILKAAGLTFQSHIYPDHHFFSADEIQFNDTRPVIMTTKDAVKVRPFAGMNHWEVILEIVPSANLIDAIRSELNKLNEKWKKNYSKSSSAQFVKGQ